MQIYDCEREYIKNCLKDNIKFQVQPKAFDLGTTTYRPDFFLPETNEYIEVIGTKQAYHLNKWKYEKVKELYPTIKLKIVDPLGNLYCSRKYNPTGNYDSVVRLRVSNELYSQIRKLIGKQKMSTFIRNCIENYIKV